SCPGGTAVDGQGQAGPGERGTHPAHPAPPGVGAGSRAGPHPPGAGMGRHRQRAPTLPLGQDTEPPPTFPSLVLRGLRHEGLGAPDAARALGVWEARRGDIDLLVTDLPLPGGDGARLAEALRQLRPGLRVLFLSGYAEADLLVWGLLPPAAPFLQKPFTLT